MGIEERPVSELSLGFANILYISLMLILLKDKTVLPVIKHELFEELLKQAGSEILTKFYDESEQDKYILKKDIGKEDADLLYQFMDEHNYKHQSFTILAIEEPEAHLHPSLQRLIYKEILHSSSTSVIFTSHSTHITSISPLDYIVHISRGSEASRVFSTVNLQLSKKEKKDIERYIDAKRGEIYFGKGIILVEGITEEYMFPAVAELMGEPLDNYGVVVCNIDSTNFKPYIQLLQSLNIPWVLCTDGDYYAIEHYVDENEVNRKRRLYHRMHEGEDQEYGHAGNENVNKLLFDLEIVDEEDLSEEDLNEQGCFIGYYTLEVDLMDKSNEESINIIKSIFKDMKSGGLKMQKNFESRLERGDYWGALDRIEAEISKGRFAQRLASELRMDMVPVYVEDCINEIIRKVREPYE